MRPWEPRAATEVKLHRLEVLFFEDREVTLEKLRELREARRIIAKAMARHSELLLARRCLDFDGMIILLASCAAGGYTSALAY